MDGYGYNQQHRPYSNVPAGGQTGAGSMGGGMDRGMDRGMDGGMNRSMGGGVDGGMGGGMSRGMDGGMSGGTSRAMDGGMGGGMDEQGMGGGQQSMGRSQPPVRPPQPATSNHNWDAPPPPPPNQNWKELCVKYAHEILAYCSVFWSFGMCVAFLGPTLLDLGCLTSSDMKTMSWVFFSQLLCSLIGSTMAGYMAQR